jgi:hypothetical protein
MEAESNLTMAVEKVIACRGEISYRRAALIAISGMYME